MAKRTSEPLLCTRGLERLSDLLKVTQHMKARSGSFQGEQNSSLRPEAQPWRALLIRREAWALSQGLCLQPLHVPWPIMKRRCLRHRAGGTRKGRVQPGTGQGDVAEWGWQVGDMDSKNRRQLMAKGLGTGARGRTSGASGQPQAGAFPGL